MTEDERKQYMKEFGQRVKMYREKLGMTQRELSIKAGYVNGTNPASTIYKIENGQIEVTQTKVAEIAEALGVEPYQLILSPQVSRLVAYAQMVEKGDSNVDI
jgi:transcriptional regulator with XRE-family HTH domain